MVTAVVEGNVGAIIEINSETDFVAKNDSFRDFVNTCAHVVMEQNPADVDALLACKVGANTVEELLRDKILTIGENIKIRRFVRYEGVLVPYIHGGGTHAVIVKFDCDASLLDNEEFVNFGKDVAMQITAVNPAYLDKTGVPADEIEKEKEILTQQAMNEGKPEAIAQKMVMGRISKYYKEVCLLEQPFVKDDKVSVGEYVDNTAKALGSSIKVIGFTRFEKGEGLQKREEDFAAEVAAQLK